MRNRLPAQLQDFRTEDVAVTVEGLVSIFKVCGMWSFLCPVSALVQGVCPLKSKPDLLVKSLTLHAENANFICQLETKSVKKFVQIANLFLDTVWFLAA